MLTVMHLLHHAFESDFTTQKYDDSFDIQTCLLISTLAPLIVSIAYFYFMHTTLPTIESTPPQPLCEANSNTLTNHSVDSNDFNDCDSNERTVPTVTTVISDDTSDYEIMPLLFELACYFVLSGWFACAEFK